jgi:hypothetical protein
MKAMRLRWAIPMLMLAGAVATASAQSAVPFTLRISGPGTVATGQPVRVRALLQNTSDHAIGVVQPFVMDDPVLSIQGPSGQEPPRKKGALAGSSAMMSIGPGEVLDDVLRVDIFYNLSQPGRYTLQLKRPIAEDRSRPDYLKAGFVSSNVITLTVSPEPVKPSAPLTLTLTGAETSVSGSDVSLKALVKNLSDQDTFLVTDPDGSVDDRYYGLRTIVGPNNARFSSSLAHAGERVIRTISPGATLEAMLDRNALGFSADWIAPLIYRFQLTYSDNADPENGRVASNVLTMNVTPPPAGPAPLTLTLSGPETVTVGDPVRVELVEKNTSNFDSTGPQGQLNLLEYSFSVLGPSGTELPLNTQAKGVTGAHTLKSLAQGWTSNAFAVLSDFYDMSQPGIYYVQMSQRAYGYPKAGRVSSNVIAINVTPAAQR